MSQNKIIQLVATQCPANTEDKFDSWYSDKHIPDLLTADGVKEVTRYRIIGENNDQNPKHLAIYEFANEQEFNIYFNSEEREKALLDWAKVQKETRAEVLWRLQYSVAKKWIK